MKKTSLLFVDGDTIKVVFGNSLKIVKFSEANLGYNQEFLRRIFDDTRVVTFDSVIDVSMEDVEAMMGSNARRAPSTNAILTSEPESSGKGDNPRASTLLNEAPMRSDGAPRVIPDPPGLIRKAQSIPPGPVAAARSPLTPLPGQGMDEGQFLKSNARTTIIIDDLLTKEEIAPGIRKALAFPPNGVVNMALHDQEQVNKSSILKRLIANKTIERVNGSALQEAMRAQAEEQARNLSDDDARLARYAPIIDGPAAKFAENPTFSKLDVQPEEVSGEGEMSIIEEGVAELFKTLPEEASRDVPEKNKSAPLPRRPSRGPTSGTKPKAIGIKRS